MRLILLMILLSPLSARVATMDTILKGCASIIQQHKSGQTEAFYHRMLQIHLYHHGIPSLSEVECFVFSGAVPVLVGRIDLEVDHTTILELKVAPRITEKHIRQLRKYVRARQSTGMHVQNASVICFTDDDSILYHHEPISPNPGFFRLRTPA